MEQVESSYKNSREHLLELELMEARECLSNTEKREKEEIDRLWRRIKTANCLLSYLRSKARIMCIPSFANTLCGIKYEEGVGYVDKKGTPMAEWSTNPSVVPKEGSLLNETDLNLEKDMPGNLDLSDEEYMEQIAKSVMLVTDAMEVLLKRTILAEAEIELERKRADESEDLVRRKALQIESMWTRVEEMEKVAKGTSGILKEMQLKLEDMEQETSRQRQRATENEQELCRVRHDFEVLKSSIDNLSSARESLLSSEKRIQEIEKDLERLNAKAARLESINKLKDLEISNLVKANDKLRASLDIKEAELLAWMEQCKTLTLESARK